MLRGRLESSPRYLQVLRLMVPMPFIAVLAGWVVTEVGRQPWMMWGEITVADGLTPSLTGPMALFTLVGYMLVYAAVFTAGVYYLTRVVRKGMVIEVAHEEEDYARPKRPFSATDVELDVGDDPEPMRASPTTRRSGRKDDDGPDLHLDRHHRLRGADVRAGRRLRPRRRHPVPVRARRRCRARRHDELGGPGLGWQRDLADPRRCRPAGRRSRWSTRCSCRPCTSACS
jgi:hypothetical protein